eukprot:2847098-Pyramimonas_sp.AAC.1
MVHGEGRVLRERREIVCCPEFRPECRRGAMSGWEQDWGSLAFTSRFIIPLEEKGNKRSLQSSGAWKHDAAILQSRVQTYEDHLVWVVG